MLSTERYEVNYIETASVLVNDNNTNFKLLDEIKIVHIFHNIKMKNIGYFLISPVMILQ